MEQVLWLVRGIALLRDRPILHGADVLEVALPASGEAKVEPCRVSFITALRYIVDQWLWRSTSTTPGAIPAKLRAMRQNIRRFVLPPRRAERRYPRAVRMTQTHYPIKKNAAQS